jgi:hypothetical protein
VHPRAFQFDTRPIKRSAEMRRFIHIVLVAYAMLTLVGAGLFLRSDAASGFTDSYIDSAVGNAPYAKGLRIKASSWDWFHGHHPLFAIDGEESPTALEKWASHPSDRHPELVIELPSPTNVEAVVITHAGAFESDMYTLTDYVITCINASGGDTEAMTVRNNHEAVASHRLHCRQASRLRISFLVEPHEQSPRHVARIYEVEVITPGASADE